MRANPTPAEALLWEHLRNRRLGSLKFRRQYYIDRFIVDFFCSSAKLVVEVDGGVHKAQQEQDRVREEILSGQGVRVIRFTNEEVITDIEKVKAQILAKCT